MNKLTAEKCRELLEEIKYNRENCFLSEKTKMLMDIAESVILEQQERGGGWVEWNGGKQPIADGREVAIKFRDGTVITETLSDCWVWSHSGDYDDIIAYRIIPEQPTNQNGEH